MDCKGWVPGGCLLLTSSCLCTCANLWIAILQAIAAPPQHHIWDGTDDRSTLGPTGKMRRLEEGGKAQAAKAGTEICSCTYTQPSRNPETAATPLHRIFPKEKQDPDLTKHRQPSAKQFGLSELLCPYCELHLERIRIGGDLGGQQQL